MIVDKAVWRLEGVAACLECLGWIANDGNDIPGRVLRQTSRFLAEVLEEETKRIESAATDALSLTREGRTNA